MALTRLQLGCLEFICVFSYHFKKYLWMPTIYNTLCLDSLKVNKSQPLPSKLYRLLGGGGHIKKESRASWENVHIAVISPIMIENHNN